jgi:hypothetical protein
VKIYVDKNLNIGMKKSVRVSKLQNIHEVPNNIKIFLESKYANRKYNPACWSYGQVNDFRPV